MNNPRDCIADNFIYMRPRKTNPHVWSDIRVPRSDELTARVEEAGMNFRGYQPKWGQYQIALTREDLENNRALLTDVIQRASGLKATPAVTPTEPPEDAQEH